MKLNKHLTKSAILQLGYETMIMNENNNKCATRERRNRVKIKIKNEN